MTEHQNLAHNWLNRNYSEWQEIQKLKQRLELSESMLSTGVSRLSKQEIQMDTSSNHQEKKQIKASYLREVVEHRIQQLDIADAKTIQVIAANDDSEERNILLSRYILRQPWRVIQREMHMETRTLYRKRDKALDKAAAYISAHI